MTPLQYLDAMIEPMRFFVLLLCAASLFGFSGIAHAYYDDSVVIEIGDVLPREPTYAPSAITPQGGAAPSATQPTTVILGLPASPISPVPGTSPFVPGGTVSSGAKTTPGGGAVVASTLFDVLTTSGGITGAASAGGASTQNSSLPSGSGAGGSASARGGGGGGVMTIDGAKIRQALLGKLSFKDILERERARVRQNVRGGTLSDRDLGLMAASTAVGDSNIDQISFGATRFEIVYRSQGYLFGFIPKSFRVRVDINPQAGDTRVAIGLPWYRFFLRTLFDKASLAREIGTIIEADGSPRDGENANDVKARLFDKISLLLQNKVGTLNAPAQQTY